MIVTTILDTNKKPLQIKPKYVKPKFPTYRQLLQLDKPKAKIFVESDNEGDDILEKLLKVEKEEKKKKKKLKEQAKSIASKNESVKGQIQSEIATQQQINKEQKVKEKSKEEVKEKKQKGKLNPEEQNTTLRKTLSRIRGSSAKRLSGLKTGNNEIMIDETDEVQYIVTHQLKAEKTKVKSVKCFNLLKQQIRRQPQQIKSSLSKEIISHKLFVDKKQQHPKIIKDEKSEWLRRFIQNDTERRKAYQTERKIRKKDALFRNDLEEERFANHLSTYRKNPRMSI